MKPTCKRVLARLRAAEGGWVRGAELAIVGGYRFGGRVHELRQAGHVIERRPDPKSALDQYRLVEGPRQLTLDAA